MESIINITNRQEIQVNINIYVNNLQELLEEIKNTVPDNFICFGTSNL